MGKSDDTLEFIDGMAEAKADDTTGTLDASTNILEIVWETILEKFGDNLRVLKTCWVDIVKSNLYVDESFKLIMKATYKAKKTASLELFKQYIEIKLD